MKARKNSSKQHDAKAKAFTEQLKVKRGKGLTKAYLAFKSSTASSRSERK